MNGSTWNRWLKTLNGSRRARRQAPRRLVLTDLESRDVPAAFTQGDIVVYRIGVGGSTPLTAAAATAAFLDEYNPTTGALVQSIPLPTATSGTNLALTASGTIAGTTILGDGSLTNSTDGRYLLAVGYDAPVGTAGVVGTAGATNPRVVGVVDSNGNINTSTGLTTGYSANNIDDAASPDGEAIWTGGFDSTGGVRQTTIGTNGPSTAINTGTSLFSKSNARIVSVANNQVYGSNSTTNIDGPFSVGTGLPTTGGQVSTALPGFPTTGSTGSPAQFPNTYQYIFDGPNTVYVADARTNGNGGLQKWSLVGGFWTLQYTIKGNPIPNTAGVITATFPTGQPQLFEGLVGLTGDFSGPNPILYGITAETTSSTNTTTPTTASGVIPQNSFVKIVDTGAGSTETVLATAPANEYFRGVALAPKPIGTTADTVSVVATSGSPPATGPAPVGTAVTFTATVTTGATGWVTFQDTSTTPATTIGVVPLTGNQASFTTSTLAVGTHTVQAIYGGDTTYLANSSSTSQVITGANTTTTLTTNFPTTPPTTAGVMVTFTATIAATSGAAAPVGTVNFYDDGNLINPTPIVVTQVGSTVTATATQAETTNPIQGANPILLTPGSHTITAVFTPASGANFVGSDDTASPLIQSVKPNTFGAGDILIYRVGDGISPTSGSTDNVVYIDEYNPSTSALVQSILMPSFSVPGGNQALTSDAFQAAEGQLSLSSDGQYVLLTGYDAPPGGPAPDTSAAASIPRTIGEISFNGTINTSMALTDAADGGSIRGAASPDGQKIYVAGSTGGVRFVNGYSAGLTTSTQIDTASNNATTPLSLQSPVIAGGQLYVSDSSTSGTVNPTIKVAQVGTGLPTTSGQHDTTLPGLPDPGTLAPGNPLGYFFTTLGTGPFVGPNTLYIADDGANFYGGAITKWTLIGTTWKLNGTIPSGGASSTNPAISPPSFNYVTGAVSGSTVNLYATFGISGNVAGGSGGLYSIVDSSGYNAFPATTPTITTMASTSTTSNEIFRGVVPVPTQAVAAPAVSNVTLSDGVSGDGTTQRSEVRQIAVTFSGPVTFAGGNANAAAAFQLKHVENGVNLANLAATVSADQTTVTLTFTTTGNAATEVDPESISGTGPNSVAVPGPSLADGLFQLTILSADVTGAGGAALNGGVNYVSPADTQGGGAGQLQLFRYYGDATGNGIVDQLDLGQFRSANNSVAGPGSSYLAYLDADNSGSIDQLDLGQFRARNNSSVFSL
jgi:hypothetical protein